MIPGLPQVGVTICRTRNTVLIPDPSGQQGDVLLEGDAGCRFILAYDSMIDEGLDVTIGELMARLVAPYITHIRC